MKKFRISVFIHGSLEKVMIEANCKEEAIGRLLIQYATTCYDHVRKIEEITE